MGAIVEIVMAVYNGEKFLDEQLASIFSQDISGTSISDQNFPNFQLIVRDNHSEDQTPQILAKWQAKYPENMKVIYGESNLGIVGNFATLLEQTKAPYVMFSDADDVWLPFKVRKSLELMRQVEAVNSKNTPILIHTDLEVVNHDLKKIAPSYWGYTRLKGDLPVSMNRALAENVVTGCTMMLNRPLVELVTPIPLDVPMHDAWIALNAATFGCVVPLKEATILYRQHGGNDTGASSYGFMSKLKKFLDAKQRAKLIQTRERRYKQAEHLLARYSNKMTDQQVILLKTYLKLKNQMKFYRFYGYWKRDLLESGFVRKLYQLLFLLVFYCSFMQLTSCSSAHQWVQHEDLAKRVMIDHGVEQEKVAKLDLVSLGVSEVGKGFESVAGAGADDRGDSQRRSQEKLEGNESRQNALGRDESEGSKIAYFSMQFLTNQKLDVKAMRKIIVENVESFIQRVNAEEELKARLLVSPITVKQLRLNIGCCDSQGDFREPPYLAYAHLSEDKICYCYYDNLFGKFIDVKDVEEPYQEAVKIVLGE